GQSPTLPHQPCVHVGAVRQLAYREHAMVPIRSSLVARQVTSANKPSQLAHGGPPTGPGLPIGIRADLICLRRIDPLQANVGARDDDGIAVNHPRFADDSGRWRRVPISVAAETECADDENDAEEPLRFRAAYTAACCFSPACPSSHRLRRHSMLRVPQTATTLSRKAWHLSVLNISRVILRSDAHAGLHSSNAEGKNGSTGRPHHPCPPPSLMHRSRVSNFSRRCKWREKPFCTPPRGRRPYFCSTHDSCRDPCHRRLRRRTWSHCLWQPPHSCRPM